MGQHNGDCLFESIALLFIHQTKGYDVLLNVTGETVDALRARTADYLLQNFKEFAQFNLTIHQIEDIKFGNPWSSDFEITALSHVFGVNINIYQWNNGFKLGIYSFNPCGKQGCVTWDILHCNAEHPMSLKDRNHFRPLFKIQKDLTPEPQFIQNP